MNGEPCELCGIRVSVYQLFYWTYTDLALYGEVTEHFDPAIYCWQCFLETKRLYETLLSVEITRNYTVMPLHGAKAHYL